MASKWQHIELTVKFLVNHNTNNLLFYLQLSKSFLQCIGEMFCCYRFYYDQNQYVNELTNITTHI